MKTNLFFPLYMTFSGLLGAYATYYCLSPMTPSSTYKDVFVAILWLICSLVALFTIRKQERPV